jgi:anti-sigma-K factor RskA
VNESLHALSGAYVVDALDDDERELFEKHLSGCLDCQREVASLREAAALMADDAALDPPPALRDSVLAGIKNIRPLPPESPEVRPDTERTGRVIPLRRRRFRMATMAAAAAILAAVGTGVMWNATQEDTSTTLSAADRVLGATDAKRVSIKFDDGSSATVVRSVSEGRAVVLTRDMAAPPEGKAFELWLQDESGAMAPAGLMKTAGDHKVLLDGDASEATGVGITVEPEEGSEQPTTDPIALFELDKAQA